MKITKQTLTILLFLIAFTACKKDKPVFVEPENPKPKLSNLELGLGDSGIGVIGKDFHFNGDIVAVDKIDLVEVKMIQKATEKYSHLWKHEILWKNYKGLKNANVHKHFTIPKDAAEGKYDLIITIYDENGSKEEIKRDFEIYTQANLPVRAIISDLFIFSNYRTHYTLHGDRDKYPTRAVKKGDTLAVHAVLPFVKGDGKLCIVLVKKTANYNPKTIAELDLKKAIVYDIYEHKDQPQIFRFSNYIYEKRPIPELIIGAQKDNNVPEANVISGEKTWETGAYNLIVLYHNFTKNLTTAQSIPINIDIQ